MKKILLFLLFALNFYSPVVKGQSFAVQADTVWTNATTTVSLFDTISVPAPVSLKWKVVACTFPSDWQVDSVFGLCDANICRQNTSQQLWNGTSGTSFTCTYPNSASNSHNFDLQLDLTNAPSTGTHLVTVSINDPITAYGKTMTFVVTKAPTGVANVNSADNNILLYPNPARDELNVVFNANADIKTIAVYNIIGKVLVVYKVNGDSANMNLENIPAGIYFVRLTNSHGDVVVTRKFAKQ